MDRQARHRAQVLDGSLADDNFPGDPQALVTSAAATLLFIRVDDPKTVKNRVHLDLQPQDRTRDEEVESGSVVLGLSPYTDGHGMPHQ